MNKKSYLSLWQAIKLARYYQKYQTEWKKSIPQLSDPFPRPHPNRIEGGCRNLDEFCKTSRPNQPSVSIVTIVYNGVRSLEQTIQSVLGQTYDNIEYIVIDGGSADGTLDIIRKYDGKIAYWLSEPDKGISDAFNKGIRCSTGEIIGIINADDWYEPNAVELSVKALIENPEHGFSFGGLALYYGEKYSHSMHCDAKYEKVINYNIPAINHPTFFVRKSVYQIYGLFSTQLNLSMDYELFLRMHMNKVKGICLKENVTCMRLEGASYKGFIISLREVLLCSVIYGQALSVATALYIIRVFKGHIRRMMENLGLGHIAHILRKILERNYHV